MVWLDWASLFIRWFHVIAGVAWIGASFYFIWLDNNLQTPPKWKQDKGIKGDLWAVHGGGFYEVAKYNYGPETMPRPLHWFKWEAYTTWISGFCLLVLIYYFGASAYLIDPTVNPLSPTIAIALGLGLIFGGLGLYELACRSPLNKWPIGFAVILSALLVLACYLTSTWFSGRGAYIHIGALIGTIMAGNVFFQIMPSQRAMVNAVENGLEIDPKWGQAAKLRSVHNNYLTLPLLFIMISNHYPMTYQHPQSWLVLALIIFISAWIRHFFNLRHQGVVKPGILISGALSLMAVAIWVSMPATLPTSQNTETLSSASGQLVKTELDHQIQELMVQHCVSCHAQSPTDEVFKIAPLGLKLDSWEQIVQQAPRIYHRTVVTRDMPFLNKSGMTDEQRELVKTWYQQQQGE